MAAAIQPLRKRFRRVGGTGGLATGPVRTLVQGCVAADPRIAGSRVQLGQQR